MNDTEFTLNTVKSEMDARKFRVFLFCFVLFFFVFLTTVTVLSSISVFQ